MPGGPGLLLPGGPAGGLAGAGLPAGRRGDAFLQVQRMVERRHTKDLSLVGANGEVLPGYPLPGEITSSGLIVAGGGTLTFLY